MGNGNLEVTGKKPGADNAQATHDDAATPNPLRDQVDRALASPPKSDSTIITEKALEGAIKGTGDEADPYTHTNRVKELTAQLDKLALENKKPDEIIVADGKQVKVKDFVKEVKGVIKSELELAKATSNNIDQDAVGTILNTNIATRKELVEKLGLGTQPITPELLQQERAKAGNNLERRNQIDALTENLSERAALEALRHAPAYTKMVEAELLGKGYTNQETALGAEVSKEDTRKAFELLKLAGNEDADLKATDLFKNAETVVGMTFAGFQQERSQKIIELMRNATEAGKTGQPQTVIIDGESKTLSQEDLLKEANRLANKINVAWVASQAMLPRNQENGTAQELMDIVSVASFARLDYVNYMSSHGQTKEAQALFMQVKTDTPYLVYNPDGTYRDESLRKLDTRLTRGIDTEGADYQIIESRFLRAMDEGNINPDKNKPGQSATELLDQMKQLNQNARREMEESSKILLTEKQDLGKKQEELEKKTVLSDAEKVELERTKREIAIIDGTLEQRNAYFNRRENIGTYLEASWLEAKEDFSAANAKYKEFDSNEKDVELKKNLGLEGKVDRTESGFSGWWNRNWGYVAVGAAIVAAAGLTVVTLGVGAGPGAGLVAATVAGVGITGTAATATATTALVGTAAIAIGTAGGAGAYWAVERTVNKDAGLESAWTGAKIGLTTSSMIVAPWATSGRAAATAATGEVVAGANVASKMSMIGRTVSAANKLGITKNTLMAGYGVAGITEGGDYALGLKSGKEAASGFLLKGALSASLIGMSSKLGAVKEATTAATASKETFRSVLGLTGKNAAIGYSLSAGNESLNYGFGKKTAGDAFKDFVVYGAVNTLAIGTTRKYMLGEGLAPAATANLRNAQYAFQGMAINEIASLDMALYNKAVQHDFGQLPVFIREQSPGDVLAPSFMTPLVARTYDQFLGNGLNPLHSGELRRFNGNLESLKPDMTVTIGVDKKYVRPFDINQNISVFDKPGQ